MGVKNEIHKNEARVNTELSEARMTAIRSYTGLAAGSHRVHKSPEEGLGDQSPLPLLNLLSGNGDVGVSVMKTSYLCCNSWLP